ncbi:phosphatidylserine decarboxylase [Salinarchaeum sp. Harcht-Bsk1]|uniref:protein sorting system archaetidylserine decarboxylase n=1 Tax=Salinarchaeum sp. Harcht-Bsk1 TaxID=1333523 RepID=UPI00034235A4|nr:protein sorting system archaetidylserine decarboxylase [Salinarchaeum sp. Harcht-Bsk1]AGN02505.1 phosphatidylserine decarboxylase [Salinarchaeum sp. Harcht-Bsk1]
MNVAPGGFRYGLTLVAAGAVALLIHPVVTAVLGAAGVAAVWFHRDPNRSIPEDGVLAPADGKISVIRNEEGRLLVGTFMNVHDVHVNRSPLSGTVTSSEHQPGGHRPAFSKESDRNERQILAVETDHGPMTVTLIAGAFARRIHPYVEAGEDLERGERIGHISFGSRVDVLFPPGIEEADLAVEHGESVRAGETVLVESDSIE